MKLKCLLGFHIYVDLYTDKSSDIEQCIHCGQIHRKGYFLGIKIMRERK